MTRHVLPVVDDAHEAYSESAHIAKAPNPASLRSLIGYASPPPAYADPWQIAASGLASSAVPVPRRRRYQLANRGKD
jgi:hypothetical protein